MVPSGVAFRGDPPGPAAGRRDDGYENRVLIPLFLASALLFFCDVPALRPRRGRRRRGALRRPRARRPPRQALTRLPLPAPVFSVIMEPFPCEAIFFLKRNV